ncbi:fungal-specific transcription factor domain-containing protein [Lophiotrema nucula]|uniref:Fungal-specific transcription factor domain-containing protein n=1 Tax=Lophiotrema nucula TaxID=690887 RepID=A0A6A5YP62_9PLEO|nr:fungal-specific transcription factor domain-containing protein [Lophiotrema nucula]
MQDETLSTAVVGALTAPSPLPHSALTPNHQDEAPQPGLSTVTSIDLSSIPRHVAEVLVKVYVDKILPQYPFFYAEQIASHFRAVYAGAMQTQHPLPRVSKYIISMVMAVSTMTSKAVDFEKPMAFSDALFYGAMQHYETLKPNTLEALQATMLICQFATFRPATADIWRAKDIAMRMAIGLGLHRHPIPKWHTLDAETVKLRANIFWVLYAMDRSFGIPTMRPLGIADEHIDAKFPEECLRDLQESQSISEDVYARRRGTQWLNHVRLRQLQSEVYGINFGTADIPFPSYQDWMSDMDRRLRLWKQNVDVEEFSETGPDWFDFVMSTIHFYLHNPCPRNPTPSEASLLICFDAASTTLHGYVTQNFNIKPSLATVRRT